MMNLDDLLAAPLLNEAFLLFLPAWLLALYTAFKAEPLRSKCSQRLPIGQLGDSSPSQSLTLLPLFLWAGTSTYRTHQYWQSAASSHALDLLEIYMVVLVNLGAGAITCCLIAAVLTARRRKAATLGLKGMHYLTSLVLIFGTLADAAFLLHCFDLFTSPAGIPLPMYMFGSGRCLG